MFTKITAAAVSLKPTKWDKDRNADKMEALIRRAAKQRPDLIVLPEGLLEGYVVNDVIHDPALADRFMALAEPIGGPHLARFRALARELAVCLCFGFAERVGQEAYNAAVFLDAEGKVCGKHHKTRLAEGYHPDWHFNRLGKKLRAFDTPLGRCGIMICNERWEPLIARALVLDGARLLLVPAYGSRRRDQNLAVLARARENGVPVVEANVGVNLIISKGQKVAYQWGTDRITIAEVEVPAPVSRPNARAVEQQYLDLQGPLMAQRRRICQTQPDAELPA